MYYLKLASIVFALKSLDCCFNTIKSVYLYKDKFLMSAIFNSISTFFYLVAITKLAKSDNIYVIISMCVATFIGTYLPAKFISRMEKDKIFVFDMVAPNIEEGKEFADKIRQMNIAVNSYVTYDEKLNKTLACRIYSTTKKESKIINSHKPEDFDCIVIPIS